MSSIRIETQHAPAAIGPYAQARRVGPWLYTSGQVGLHPTDGELVSGGVEGQTQQALNNLQAILKAAKLDTEHVVKTTIFLDDMEDFGTVNRIYAEFFGDHKPARSTVEVARLPKDALIEIECIAFGEPS